MITPGPWMVRRSLADDTYTHIYSAAVNTLACTKSEADARLIAAAPDLLDALQVLSLVANYGQCYHELNQARAAIDKATGRAA